MRKIYCLLNLTRYKEYYGADLAITSMGLLLIRPVSINLIILIACANFLSTAFAFAINDIEDAKDDKKNSKRRIRNQVSNGCLKRREALIFASFLFFSSIVLYSQINTIVFVLGSTKIILSFLYSWRGIRLKSIPFLGIFIHAMFGLLSFLAALFVIPHRISILDIVIMGGAIALSSALGDIKAEIRDYEEDQKSKINNTANNINLSYFYKYLDAAEIIVLVIMIIYLVINLPIVSAILYLAIVIITSIHFYNYYMPKKVLILDYPERHISFAVVSILFFATSMYP